MKVSITIKISIVLALVLLAPPLPCARHVTSKRNRHVHHEMARLVEEEKVVMKSRGGLTRPLGVAGSTLPDCSHACGSCSPCKLVIVSFVCASIEEAESCPVAYRCMCKNKAYPVP